MNYGCQSYRYTHYTINININVFPAIKWYEFFFFSLVGCLLFLYNLDKSQVISNLLMANKSLVWIITNQKQIKLCASEWDSRYLKFGIFSLSHFGKRDIYVYLYWSMFVCLLAAFFVCVKRCLNRHKEQHCCKQKSNYNQNIKWLSSSKKIV